MKLSGLHISATLAAMVIGVIIGQTTMSSNQHEPPTRPSPPGAKNNQPHSLSGKQALSFQQKMNAVRRLITEHTHDGTITDHADFNHALWKISRTMSAKEIQQALAEFGAMDLSERVKQAVDIPFVHDWAKQDGPMAMDYALKTKSKLLWQYAANAWLTTDPSGADQWLQIHREALPPKTISHMESGIIKVLAIQNLEQALARASQSPAELQVDSFAAILETAIHDDKKLLAISNAALSLQNQQIGRLVAAKLVRSLSHQDINKASEFVEGWEGKKKADLVFIVGRKWVGDDPSRAMDWTSENLDDSANRQRELSGLLNQWAGEDPADAETWLSNLPTDKQDSLRSSSFHQFAYQKQYPKAIQRVEKIKDLALRTSGYKTIYDIWNQANPAEATEWLHTLPAEDQQEITKDSPSSQ